MTSPSLCFTFLMMLGMTLLSGCVTEQSIVGSPSNGARAPIRPQSNQASLSADFHFQPGGSTLTIDVRAAISMLGSVPFDSFILPLVSPDGQLLATEAGIAPDWSMILAEPGATVPEATRIEIHQLDLRSGIPENDRRNAQKIGVVDEPVLLGRGSNRFGFLIESPRPNGSRWIGLVSWNTGDIQWLVKDEYVNAFASLGPNGQLAWCRRKPGDTHFELVVKRGDEEWVFNLPDQDWLFPHFSGRDDGLFFFTLREGRLDLTYAVASSQAAMRQSLRSTPIATGSNIYIAYQTMASTIDQVGLIRPRFDQITFIHPAHSSAAIWRPLSAAGAAPVLLAEGSMAAVADETDIAFVSTPRDLLRQSLVNPKVKAKLLAGLLIPRRINNPNWHSVLLSPQPQDGRIGLSVIRLLPPER
ncbi:MAG: hypothetical protein O7G85_11180 [Planctomycetota bacterium]|nr:hypothetical protein [Planctomycetota bacterium]